MTAKRFRVFVSSPSDVFAERERLERVITRLNGEFGGNLLEAVRWERTYYSAAKTFQDQIPLPSQTDLVVCILWKRLGFELPADYRRPDGTTPTGTEYEFEDAIQAARSKGTPDVLVYRKAAPVLLDAEQVEQERAQFESLKRFWSRWFRNETGHFTAAYQTFETTDQFEAQVEDHIRQWLARHKVASAGVTWPIETRGSPFRGLQPFDAAHAEVFFGRRRTTERARERLTDAARRGMPFLLVLGTSGSGKSSLARAGLLPRLTQPGAVPGVDVWRRCILRPSEGDTPVHALARALYRPDAVPELADGDSPTPPELAALLASSPDSAARAVSRALARGGAPVAVREGFTRAVEARLLLVVDQIEEALSPPEVRDGFARALAALAATGVVWIVATLRSDLYAPFQASAPLMAMRDAGAQLDLVPPAAAELAEVVTGPAAAAGLRYDARPDGTGLDEELTRAASQPGALPLLQLALDALFEARDPAANLMTCAAYDALGGLSGVMERRAEATLHALDAEAQGVLPAVLRALVDVTDEGVVTGRTAPLHEAARTPEAIRLVGAFVIARLLVADAQGEETGVRVAHDALLHGWPRAASVIAADLEMLRTRGRVDAAARRWVQEGRDPDFLLPPGRPLAEAAELAAQQPETLAPDSAEFIARSRAADEARKAVAEAHAQRELRLEAEAQQTRADAALKVVRRTRLAATAVSVLLLLAAGAAVFANSQRQEAQRQAAAAERNFATAERNRETAERNWATAEQNREAAERNFTQSERNRATAERSFAAALDGATSLVNTVNAHLRDGTMTKQAARFLLDDAEANLGKLASSAPAAEGAPAEVSAEMLDARSKLQSSFSDVLLFLGDGRNALARAQDARAIAEQAARQAPSDARQRGLSVTWNKVGDALEAGGDLPGALAAYRTSVSLVEALVAREPGNGGWQRDLWISRDRIAQVLRTQGDTAGALKASQDGLAWIERFAAEDPGNTGAQRDLVIALANVAKLLDLRGDPAGALAAEQRAAEVVQALVRREPDNLEWQRQLSIREDKAADLLYARGDVAGALARRRASQAISERLIAADPGNTEWQRDAELGYKSLAVLLARQGNVAGALAAARMAEPIAQRLADRDPGNAGWQRDLALVHAQVGAILTAQGDEAGARSELAASLAAFEKAAVAAPGDVRRQHDIAIARYSFGVHYSVHKHPAEAAEQLRAGLGIAERLVALEPGNTQFQGNLANFRTALGDTLSELGDLPGALALFDADAKDSGRLADQQPNNPQWLREVAVSQRRAGKALERTGDADGALVRYRSALTAAEAISAKDPGNGELRYAVGQVHDYIGTLLLGRSDLPGALEQYSASLAVAEALVGIDPSVVQWRIQVASSSLAVGKILQLLGREEEAKPHLEKATATIEQLRGGQRAAR